MCVVLKLLACYVCDSEVVSLLLQTCVDVLIKFSCEVCVKRYVYASMYGERDVARGC